MTLRFLVPHDKEATDDKEPVQVVRDDASIGS